jgi:hypothetical protein
MAPCASSTRVCKTPSPPSCHEQCYSRQHSDLTLSQYFSIDLSNALVTLLILAALSYIHNYPAYLRGSLQLPCYRMPAPAVWCTVSSVVRRNHYIYLFLGVQSAITTSAVFVAHWMTDRYMSAPRSAECVALRALGYECIAASNVRFVLHVLAAGGLLVCTLREQQHMVRGQHWAQRWVWKARGTMLHIPLAVVRVHTVAMVLGVRTNIVVFAVHVLVLVGVLGLVGWPGIMW